jgi:hypothetical protein
MSRRQKVASETSAGQIGAEGDFRVGDTCPDPVGSSQQHRIEWRPGSVEGMRGHQKFGRTGRLINTWVPKDRPIVEPLAGELGGLLSDA